MKPSRQKIAAAFVGAGVTLTSVLACNVFASLEQCDGDGDCTNGAACDPAGHFCIARETTLPEAGAEAEGAPPSEAGDAPDAYVPTCRGDDPLEAPHRVAGFESTPVISARLFADETSVIYSALSAGCVDESCFDLNLASRETRTQPFTLKGPAAFSSVNCGTASEYWPTLTADKTVMFFESSRASKDPVCGTDRARIWTASRSNARLPDFQVSISSVFRDVTSEVDGAPYLHPSGNSLYFASIGRPKAIGNFDIWLATLDPQLHTVNTVEPLAVVNTEDAEHFPVISLDEKTLIFSRGEFGTETSRDIYVATRATPSNEFSSPKLLLGGPTDDISAWLSDDQCRVYFTSNRGADGGTGATDYRLYVAERKPR